MWVGYLQNLQMAKRKASSSMFSKRIKRARLGYGPARSVSPYSSSINRSRPKTVVPLCKTQAFPDYLDTNLTYYQQTSLTCETAGLADHHLFRCNSIYDPDFTGTGHQPSQHDNLALIYQNYRVIRSKIEVIATSPGGLAGQAVIGIRRSHNTQQVLDPEQLMEQPDITSRMLTNSLASVKLRKYWNIKHAAKPTDGDDFNAPFGANPTQNDFFNIFAFNPDPTVVGAKIPITVKITYTVRCYDIVTQAKS